MRALITGGRGFVGRHLEDHLVSKGDEVSIIDLETDVTDADAVTAAVVAAQPEVIYHLAALAHVGDSWSAPAHVLSVNVIGTANVLAAARQLEHACLVLVVSSAEVYGIVGPDDLPLSETAEVKPASPYAASKAAAEQVALQATRGFGQKVIVARPFNHVGPGQAPTFAVPALAKRIVDAVAAGSRSLPVGTLSTRRDFTDVRDVVAAYRLLVVSGRSGEIYNVCSGHDVEIAEVAASLLRLAETSLELATDPSLVRPVDVPVLRGDSSKLTAETGWAPTIDLETTLRDVLESFGS
ncbi:MAG: GDP-mannose 4,6-dehydratase [Actinomycetes bacterium]